MSSFVTALMVSSKGCNIDEPCREKNLSGVSDQVRHKPGHRRRLYV